MIEPRRGSIAVRIIEADEVSPGGVIIPGSAKRPILKGVVVAVGPSPMAVMTGQEMPIQSRVGDHVLWPAGIEVMVHTDVGHGREKIVLMMDSKLEAIVARDQPTAPEKRAA